MLLVSVVAGLRGHARRNPAIPGWKHGRSGCFVHASKDLRLSNKHSHFQVVTRECSGNATVPPHVGANMLRHFNEGASEMPRMSLWGNSEGPDSSHLRIAAQCGFEEQICDIRKMNTQGESVFRIERADDASHIPDLA